MLIVYNSVYTADSVLRQIFQNVEAVEGSVLILENPSLSKVGGWFPQLKSITGSLKMSRNPTITSIGLTSFSVLTSIGADLSIDHSPVLATLDGFNSLERVGGSFHVGHNGQLHSVDGILRRGANLVVEKSLFVGSNPGLSEAACRLQLLCSTPPCRITFGPDDASC